MHVPPFHARNSGLRSLRTWHDNNDCHMGQRIALTDRVRGKGTVREQCHYCQILAQPRSVQRPAHLLPR